MLLCMPSQAFDVLERMDPNPEFYEAKRGAAVGVFQAIIAGKEQVRQALNHYRPQCGPCCMYVVRALHSYTSAISQVDHVTV
jgi:intraflagellar transport protein 56